MDAGSPQPWTAKALGAELGNAPPSLFALRIDGRPLGFAVVRLHPPELDLVNLVVSPQDRRHGRGRALLRAVIGHALRHEVQTVFLEVRAGNTAAIRLYASAGFKETQRRPNFYANPSEDALLMRLELPPGTGLKGPQSAC